MAHSWININRSDISSGNLLKNKTSKLGDLKNNVKHLAELFGTDGNQLRSSDSAVTSGVATSEEVVKLVQDINALDFTKSCTSYNSTQYTDVCSSLFGQFTNQGSNFAENTNCGDNGDFSDNTNFSNDSDNSHGSCYMN